MVKLVIRKEQGQARYYTEFLEENIGLEMTLIPDGTFLMGSPDDELERRKNESPQHRVTVPSFFIGRYPITQAQWRVVAGWEPVERELDPDPSHFKDDPKEIPLPSPLKRGRPDKYESMIQTFSRWNRPVECVSWYDAKEFCVRLSQRTKKDYRLPTEAEWEYACRAGTTTPFHFGKIITTDYVNYDGNYTYGESPKGEYREQTTPVGYFQVANAFGLYDMHGNVYEWCEDDYHDSYENAPTDGSAWLSTDASTTKIRRGGCWSYDPDYCRCAYRNYYYFADYRFNNIGLRVVRVAPRILP
ncbi:formylglycine-generating enzyme family protein [Coleofasciculus sp. C1-SOL-03]|uniref:formylglycine-generating enzyme family protein n=1 Tax=Coleofasciculus sp. C1-SOL-03 TaxID=3069522 RepID=UPI0040629187